MEHPYERELIDAAAKAAEAFDPDDLEAYARAHPNGSARGITEDERALVNHVCMWGSDGYPVRKLGRGWTWGPWRSVNGPPTKFKTKREATAHFERFHEILLDALAGRL